MKDVDEQTTSSLIDLSPAGAGLSPNLLTAPGGFLWWYADLIDEKGNGLVVIWSFGLPFLPGYASAARRGNPPRPVQKPSLNVSIYRRGRPDFYLLQEFAPDEVQWLADDDGDRWTFGKSRLRSYVDDGQRHLHLDLHLQVPSMARPTTIELMASGPGRWDEPGCHDPAHRCHAPLPEHDWTPLLCACPGRADINIDGRPSTFEGRLYHDRNGGAIPLQDLGIEDWIWGRVALPEGDFIFYVLQGSQGLYESLYLLVDEEGATKRLTNCHLRRGKARKNLSGLTWWPEMAVEVDHRDWLHIEHRHVVDSGPFYLRSILEARNRRGETSRGIAEFCQPHRIDRMLHRPLVNMRVHRRPGRDDADRANSSWLPLFTGPRRGRLLRQLRSLLSSFGGDL